MLEPYAKKGFLTRCPGCQGALSQFKHHSETHYTLPGESSPRRGWVFSACIRCHHAAIAHIALDGNNQWQLDRSTIYPYVETHAVLPTDVPDGVVREFREAERCMSVGSYRAASALLRSVLEKCLKAAGYVNGSLYNKIEQAAADGVITEARKKKAHEDIRVLGNDVVHDDWRAVSQDEVLAAHHYSQRILEDLYDDRPSVEAIIAAKRAP